MKPFTRSTIAESSLDKELHILPFCEEDMRLLDPISDIPISCPVCGKAQYVTFTFFELGDFTISKSLGDKESSIIIGIEGRNGKDYSEIRVKEIKIGEERPVHTCDR